VFVSVASYWEIVIKSRRGRLTLPTAADEWFRLAVDSGCLLAIETPEIDEVHKLTPAQAHNDPFDHVIIATAKRHGLRVITADNQFRHYGVHVEW
jgi:PIN domain nuclease of toxin-antitoxin system